MKTVFYKIECLTNLHVGSDKLNYQLVDNEVEKDAITGLPIIHASGIKGALRAALSSSGQYSTEDINRIFGTESSRDIRHAGTHKFLDATLLSRPLRVAGSCEIAAVNVTTVDTVNRFVAKLEAFGAPLSGLFPIRTPDFGQNAFLASVEEAIRIEGEPTGRLNAETKAQLAPLFAGPYALAQSFDDYDLPVIARNCLVRGHENLWYEEVVPHGSVLYFAVVYPDNTPELLFPLVVQIGGNTTIGCGFTKISKISESTGSGQA